MCLIGPMADGILKNTNVKASEVGGGTKMGPMAAGTKTDEFFSAVQDGKEAARQRVLLYLNENCAGGWHLASAQPNRRGKVGEMDRDPGAKAGDKPRSRHAWCYARGVNTYTLKQVKEMFLPTGGLV
jgi:hypothetical protein